MEGQHQRAATAPERNPLGIDLSRLKAKSKAFLEGRPKLYADLLPVWETWKAVKGQRSGLSEIRISELRAYLDEEGITDWRERKRHREAVRILDAEQLRLIDADREKAAPKPKPRR